MPLKPRQHNEAVQYMFETLREQGFSDDQIAADLQSLSPADQQRAFSKAWKTLYEQKTGGDTSGKLGAAITGFGESFGFKGARVLGAIAGAAQGLVEDLDPIEGAQKGWQKVEDRITYHEVTNPTTYNLFNLAGYASPRGLAAQLFKGGQMAATALGAGAKAAIVAGSGTAAAGQTLTERPIEGEFSAGQAALDIGLGLAAPKVASSLSNVAASGGKSIKSAAASGLATIGRTYSKAIGKASDLTDELLENAPAVAKVLQEGVPALKTKVNQASEDLLTNVKGYIEHLKSAAAVPEGEFTRSAGEMRNYFLEALDDLGNEIATQASSTRGLVRDKIKESFDAVKGLAELGRKAVKAQYGQRISPLEELGKDLQIDITDAVNGFADPLIDAGLLVNRSGTVANLPNSKQLQAAFAKIFAAKKSPLNFKGVNDLKMTIGEVVDWNAQDPLNVALKNLYTGLRTKLVESGKTLPTDINVERLFGEYQSALQLGSKFQNAFYAKAADGVSETLPSSAKLKELINLGKGFSELQVVGKETQRHLSRMIRMSARETKLARLEDPFKISSQLKTLAASPFFDEKTFTRKFEQVVGKIKNRQAIFQVAENWNLPQEAKMAIKAGGATFQDFMENLPPLLKESRPQLQQLHDRWQKLQRVSGYRPNEVFEILKSKQAIDPAKLDDLRELASLSPEFDKLVSSENLLRLAQSSETKLKLMPSLTRSVGLGAPLTWMGGPKLALAAGMLERLHAVLTQPAALRLLAEKHKWVPSSQAAEWAQRVSFIAAKVLPAVRGQTNQKEEIKTAKKFIPGQ